MQMPGATGIHAAVVIVRRDHLALALARDHLAAGVGVFVVGLDLAREIGVVPRRPGADEAAVLVQTAVDGFAGDDVLEDGERVGAGAHQLGLLALELLGDRALAAQPLAEIGADRDYAAIARLGAAATVDAS